jgi:hypothetical protein
MHTVTIADILSNATDIARINRAISVAALHMDKLHNASLVSAILTLIATAAEVSSDRAHIVSELVHDHDRNG